MALAVAYGPEDRGCNGPGAIRSEVIALTATSGPGSDLDIIVHWVGTEEQRDALSLWLDGWSRSLAEINYLRTGYRAEQLLDIHFVSDEDIEKRTIFAVKIGAITDAARPLKMGGSGSGDQ